MRTPQAHRLRAAGCTVAKGFHESKQALQKVKGVPETKKNIANKVARGFSAVFSCND